LYEHCLYDYRKGVLNGLSLSTKCRAITALNMFVYYIWEVTGEIVVRLPMEKKVYKKKTIALTNTEITDIVNRIGKESQWKDRDMLLFRFAVETGLRTNELSNVRAGDIDLDNCRVKIPEGKGGKERWVSFSKGLGNLLFDCLAHMASEGEVDYLFCSQKGGNLTPRAIQHIFSKYGVYPNRLRHTFATNKAKGFMDKLLTLQREMGHDSFESTKIYIEGEGVI
jgi:integrase/recombinase XerD